MRIYSKYTIDTQKEMLKELKFLTILSVVIFAASCSNQEDLKFDPKLEIALDENFVSSGEALETADEYYTLMFGDVTRSSRGVANIEMVGITTKNGCENSMHGLYLINYGDDKGFALVSADKRREKLYAISDEGSLHMSDTIENKALAEYISDVLASGMSINFPSPTDTMSIQPNLPKTEVINILRPCLTGDMANFSQHAPFNKYCFTNDGRQSVVGCGPLAVGTMFSYFSWPNSIGEYSFNWNNMKNNFTLESWARLFEILGRPNYLMTFYGETYATTSGGMIPFTINRLGYSGAKRESLDYYNVYNDLQRGNPLICDSPSHIWIIDGWINIKTTTPLLNDTTVTYGFYPHCVWGFGGQANGYYLFSTSAGTIGGAEQLVEDGLFDTVRVYGNLYVTYGYQPNK